GHAGRGGDGGMAGGEGALRRRGARALVDAIEAIRTRRSLRQLAERPVPRGLLDELLELACVAPAPHHTRPWRYVVVSQERRAALAEAMGAAWRRDLEGDGHPE